MSGTNSLTAEEQDILGLDAEAPTDELGQNMDKLASKLMDEALAEGANIETRLDVFKAVAGYRLGLLKHPPKVDKPEAAPTIFGAAKHRINGATRQ